MTNVIEFPQFLAIRSGHVHYTALGSRTSRSYR
jgi:hypothetical protein